MTGVLTVDQFSDLKSDLKEVLLRQGKAGEDIALTKQEVAHLREITETHLNNIRSTFSLEIHDIRREQRAHADNIRTHSSQLKALGKETEQRKGMKRMGLLLISVATIVWNIIWDFIKPSFGRQP